MARFEDIIGQEHIKNQLKQAVASNRPGHAYVIVGDRYSGKEFIAKTFAQALQCSSEGDRPCCTCSACKQAMAGNHPDIIKITHEKPNTIGVDDVRNQIVNDMVIKPYNGRYKIYIINEGEKMTPSTQNALLKTLEEPPAYGIIMILTTNENALLSTILSRATVITMKPVPDKLVKKYLQEEAKVPSYKADIAVAFARGNIGKAKLLASSEEFDNIRNEALSLLHNISNMDDADIISNIKSISEYKLEIGEYLDIIAVWYRDILMYKATKDMDSIIFKEEVKTIIKMADNCAYEGIEEILKALETAKTRLRANVSFDLTIELLLMTIRDYS